MSSPITNSFPTLQFDQPWQLLCPDLIRDPEASIRVDEDLLQQVCRGECGPLLCIKTEPRCLVVTRREARMGNFAQASLTLAAEGWPVVVRSSGGSCVPQGPGMLNLSVIHPRIKGWTLEDGYLLLCELLDRLLTSFGIQSDTGEVPGSFCDGRYNLQVDGKKLVGTAQRWGGGNREQSAVLAHACLLVDLDLPEVTEKINQLYQLCNNPQAFEPTACTTMRSILNPTHQTRDAFIASIEERLAGVLCDAFDISSHPCR